MTDLRNSNGGNADAIAACLIALVDIPPSHTAERAHIYDNLGDLYNRIGKLNESISAYLHAIDLDPASDEHWQRFAEAVKYAEFTHSTEAVKQTILTCFSKPLVDPQHLAVPALSLLKLLPLYGSEEPQILEDALLLELLRHTIIPDAGFEAWMTGLRRRLLQQTLAVPEKFTQALAQQCQLNEFVYQETEDETLLITGLTAQQNALTTTQRAVLACYRQPEDSTELAQEKLLAAQIPSIKPITNEVSKLVQSQYEENPYPRWFSIPHTLGRPLKDVIQHLCPSWSPDGPLAAAPKVLIAGCGTGQQALKAALQYADSHILAIDLSLRSLAYASRKARELNVKNIEFMQGDILDLPLLGRTFDLIECSGVLHHMQDPLAGWQALASILKPQGIMSVSLYSEAARQDVVAARNIIQGQGLPPTIEGIRQCRSLLLANPTFNSLTRSVDFYTVSACRDLLFHVQEQRFTLPQISAALVVLNMELIGLEIRDPSTLTQYASMFPDDPQALSLQNWHDFEQQHPHTFMGMYHLWLRENGREWTKDEKDLKDGSK